MSTQELIQLHNKHIIYHRILYTLLILCGVIIFADDSLHFPTVIGYTLGITLLIMILETVFAKLLFFEKTFILKAFVFIQYFLYLILLYIQFDNNIYFSVAMLSLLILFMFEFSYYTHLTDTMGMFGSLVALILPAILCVTFQFCIYGVDTDAFLVFVGYSMACIVDIYIVNRYYALITKNTVEKNYLYAEIDSMRGVNDELIRFKDRTEKVNEELNMQKIKLTQMYKEINQYNNELSVQAEILKFINKSMAVEPLYVMDYIIDTVMQVRNVELCGIYIREGVYSNKHAESRVRCMSLPSLNKLEDFEYLYDLASYKEGEKTVIRDFSEEELQIFNKTQVKALLILPLFLDGEKYGVLISGSRHYHAFEDYIRFYDIIVPQFNLSINNTRLFNKMRYMAQKDGLTGINNRIHFNELFTQQMEQALIRKNPLTVALFDIDKFKRINDTYGHAVGDEVIKKIASITSEQIEDLNLGFVCRYGGEEFVVALPNYTAQQAMPIFEKLHKTIGSTTVECHGHIVSMSISLGITSYPELCSDVNMLLKRCDWAMYYAKEHGRNQIKLDGEDVMQQ